MFEPARDSNLVAAEAALSSLTPASSLNRDLLLFRAGQSSVQRRWIWPAMSGGLTLVAASLAVAFLIRPAPDPIHEVQYVRVEVPAARRAEPDRSEANLNVQHAARSATVQSSRLREYHAVQDQLLRWGLDAVPSPHRLAAELPIAVQDPQRLSRPADPSPFGWPWLQNAFTSGDRL